MPHIVNAERRWAFRCPVCKRLEVLEMPKWKAVRTLREHGWRLSSQFTDDTNRRVLVCPKHVDGSGYTLYLDAETDRRKVRPENYEIE